MKSFSIAKFLYLPLILVLCAAYSWRVVGSGPDAWAHAAIGRWILENRQAPHSSLFLWSANQPWIAHSWLFEVFAAWLLGFGERTGAYLLLGFNVLFTALTFATVWWIWRRSGTLSTLTPFLFILAIQASNTRFQARAESFSVLFLAVLFAILTHRRSAQNSATAEQTLTAEQNVSRKRGLFFIGALTVLMVLWTNLHGVVAAGVLTLWVTALLEIAQTFRATKKVGAWPLWLLAAAIISTLATLLNPYGAHYWLMLRQGSDQPLIFSFVDEWKPFWQAPTLAPEIIFAQILLGLLALVAWLRTPARRWSHLAWLLVMAALFLSSRRNSWLLSVTSLSVLGLYGAALAPTLLWRQWQSQRLKSDEGVDESTPTKDEAFAVPPALQSAGRGLAVLALFFAVWQGAPPMQAFAQPLAVPTRMADFLQDRKPPGRWFNEYDQSPYLQWRFAGNPPLYIDTLSAYTDEVLLNYLHVMQATPRGRYWLDAAKVNTIVMPRLRPDEQPPKLFFFLHQNPQWRLIYLDNDGIVWTRRKPLAAK